MCNDMTIKIEIQGPCVCDLCLRGPAFDTPRGFRCQLHWTMDIAEDHPVPMPSDPAMVSDLEQLNLAAIRKLHDLKASNFQDHQKVPECETPEQQLAHVRRLTTERLEQISTGTNHTHQ